MPKLRKPLPAALPDPETIDLQQLAADLRSGAVELVCVLGPTASGKTALSLALAERQNAEILSCDSMQIYRGMDVGTAKATPEEAAVIGNLAASIVIRQFGCATTTRQEMLETLELL